MGVKKSPQRSTMNSFMNTAGYDDKKDNVVDRLEKYIKSDSLNT